MTLDLSIFKAYDVRGVVPDQLNEDMAYAIGRAYSACSGAQSVVLGRDIRATSEGLLNSLAQGLMDGGTNVKDLGLCGTEEVSFAAAHLKLDGGIMVTASHNPIEYNGLKILGKHGKTLETPFTLPEMKAWLEQNQDSLTTKADTIGTREPLDNRATYIQHMLNTVDVSALKPLKIVANCGNGVASVMLQDLAKGLPMIDFVMMNETPDGTFPNGIPNPLLPENRAVTTQAVRQHDADLGLAWDGDADRCFLFNAAGTFVSAYQLSSIIASAYINENPGAKIIHDPRLEWNTRKAVEQAGGEAIRAKCGYTFIKAAMAEHGAVFGAEASGHFFFADFYGADSGMLPWLKTIEIMSKSDKSLTTLMLETSGHAYACDEINRRLTTTTAPEVLATLESGFTDATEVLKLDGLSLTFADWRCNIRSSNTEPLLRINVEATSPALAAQKQAELLAKIDALGAEAAAGH